MSFLNPFLFVALGAVAIPVIIHFINFRKPKKVAFSTLAFFQELQKSTIRRLNLKRYLLLLTRILAISMLVIALARPFIPSEVAGWFGTGQQSSVVAVMIDNGPSMMQVDEAGPYMDQALRVATEIIEQSDDGTRFLIVPSHGQLDSGRLMRTAEALNFLDQLEAVNKGAYPSQRMSYIRDRIADEPGESGSIYWISDARKTQLDKLEDPFDEDVSENGFPVTFIKIGNDTFQNVAVTEVEIEDQILVDGVPAAVAVTVRNFGDQPVYNSYLSMEIDGERIGQYELNLEPDEEEELLFEVIPGSHGTVKGMAVLEGGTYTFDHRRYFSLEVPESRNVLLVHDEGEDASNHSYLWPLLSALSETGTGINTDETDIQHIREYDLDEFDALLFEDIERIPEFLHAELVQLVQQGRGIFLLPSEKADMEHYNRFLAGFQAGSFTGMRGTYGRLEEVASLEPLSEGHLLIEDVFESHLDEDLRIDMPSIYHHWRYESQGSSGSNTLLRTNLGEPLFVRQAVGEGIILVGTMGIGPGWSDLAVKPIFAPLVHRLLLFAVAWEDGGMKEHILGRPFDEHVGDFGTEAYLTLNGDQIRPETAVTGEGVRVHYTASEWTPGWLELKIDDQEYTIAVNQHISESDFTSLTVQETESFLNDRLPLAGVIDVAGYSDTEIRSEMASISFGREIWSWFIWLALAFLVAECIISKQYRAERSAD